MVKLTSIPMVPSMNMAYPSNRFGRRFKSKEFKEWEREFSCWCLSHAEEVNHARKLFSKPKPSHIVRIDSEFYFPREEIITLDGRPKRNDSSNRLKILHDGIATAIWLDDCHFFDGYFIKRPIESSLPGYCDVSLYWLKVEWLQGLQKPPRRKLDS